MDQAVDSEFLTLTDDYFLDGNFYNKIERQLLSIHVNHGRIGIFIFCDMAENEYNSRAVTVSLTKPNLEQKTVDNVNRAEGKYYT